MWSNCEKSSSSCAKELKRSAHLSNNQSVIRITSSPEDPTVLRKRQQTQGGLQFVESWTQCERNKLKFQHCESPEETWRFNQFIIQLEEASQSLKQEDDETRGRGPSMVPLYVLCVLNVQCFWKVTRVCCSKWDTCWRECVVFNSVLRLWVSRGLQ